MRQFRVLTCLFAAFTILYLTSCADSKSGDADKPAETQAQAADTESPTDSSTSLCADKPYVQMPGAAQDSFTSPANFLRCSQGKYALCYYSGADPLPCTLADDTTGNCQCQVFDATDDEPMYVEIGGILNQCIHEETVAQCGSDGAGCQNLCIDKPFLPGCENASPDAPVAVACDYIAEGTFNPNAEFISTFSFKKVNVPNTEGVFGLGSTSLEGQYAGCMTAPCTGQTSDESHQYTTCSCPLWPTDGSSAPYQFGRACTEGDTDPTSPGYCTLAEDQIWSAAVSEMVFESSASE